MRLLLAALAATALLAPALSQERWIGGGHRNAAGEWCCETRGCALVPQRDVIAEGEWYTLLTRDRNGVPDIWETIPFSEAQPSADGDYWRCARADGSRRCFFAPRPSS
jgi:hypothetical protein